MSDAAPLRLHVPEPSARPGQTTDFSYLKLSPAGALPALPLATSSQQTASYTQGLIRVLDDDGNAVGDWAKDIPDELLLRASRQMRRAASLGG